jgi:accessory gene regulator protein AgrB
LYFDYIFLQGIWEKFLLLRRFIHCKHSKNTIFLCVLISIAHLVFIAVDVQFTVFYYTAAPYFCCMYLQFTIGKTSFSSGRI